MELKNFFAQDDQGNALAYANCYVFVRGTESLVNGLQAANGLPLSNPFVSDLQGLIQFAAPNGLYDVRVEKDNRDYRIRAQFNDVSETVATAEAAASRAEVARDAAQLSAGVYSDTVAGLAATAFDEYFSVPAAQGDEYLVLFQNVAGTAVEKKRYPSAAALADVLSRIRDAAQESLYFSVADEAGFVRLWASNDGGFGTEEAYHGPKNIVNEVQDIGPSVPGVDFSINDPAGFSKLALLEDGSLETPSVGLSPSSFRNDAFEIRASAPGVRFAVGDETGFYAVYVGDTESLLDTGALQAAVSELQKKADAPPVVGMSPGASRRVIAHRGVTVGGIAPENSLDAYKLAARAGFRLVETDVLKTSDGQFVIMHDASINRTCRNAADYSAIAGVVNVRDTSLATLRANYVLAADNPRYRRKIPTLAEFLATCRDFNLYPVIELKDLAFSNADVAAITEQSVAVLGVRGLAFTGFKSAQLDHVRTLYESIELYYIYEVLSSSAIDHVVAQAPSVLYGDYLTYNNEVIAETRKKGVRVAAYTIPNNQFDSLLKLGLEEFATNTLAPEFGTQSVIFRNFSDGDFAEYATTGTVGADGTLFLAPDQTLTFSARPELFLEFGAYYLSLDFIGTAAISANRLNGTISNGADDFRSYFTQCLLHAESVAITVTGGVGGCSIKDIRLTIVKL